MTKCPGSLQKNNCKSKWRQSIGIEMSDIRELLCEERGYDEKDDGKILAIKILTYLIPSSY